MLCCAGAGAGAGAGAESAMPPGAAPPLACIHAGRVMPAQQTLYTIPHTKQLVNIPRPLPAMTVPSVWKNSSEALGGRSAEIERSKSTALAAAYRAWRAFQCRSSLHRLSLELLCWFVHGPLQLLATSERGVRLGTFEIFRIPLQATICPILRGNVANGKNVTCASHGDLIRCHNHLVVLAH